VSVAPAPTPRQFARHAELFGPECVVETAAAYLPAAEVARLEIELARLNRKGGKPRPAARRQRRTTWSLLEQVRELDRRGMVSAAIADTLNVSDRRVTAILAQSQTSRNGARKRLGRAANSAAKASPRPLTLIDRPRALSGAHGQEGAAAA
jgi:hypothetical protein